MTPIPAPPPTEQAELRQRLHTALGAGGTALLVDGTADTEASLDLGACAVSQTRHFRSLTMTAADEPGRALPLTGRLTVRGRPIVRSANAAGRRAQQQDLYESLLALVGSSAVLEIVAGVVTTARPAIADDPRAADVLSALFATDLAYRTVTGLGVGLDLDAQALPGNHEANTAVGGTGGQLFAALGDLAGDAFEIILGSPATLIAADGTAFAQQDAESCAVAPRRRLNRVKSASCGCH